MNALPQFIEDLRDLTTASDKPDDEQLAVTVGALLQDLVSRPGAVPEEFTRRPDTHGGRGRWLLHRAPTFTISSIVWAPGEVAPPHTHETWGAIGLVANRIEERRYERSGEEHIRAVDHHRHDSGDVSILVPDDDIHSMHNLTRKDTVEIHVYGKDLTGLRRTRWSLEGDGMTELVSGGYANC